MFTLKVIHDHKNRLFKSNKKHFYGGIDTTQEMAFLHLIPSGEVDEGWEEILFDLAAAHNWKIEVTDA